MIGQIEAFHIMVVNRTQIDLVYSSANTRDKSGPRVAINQLIINTNDIWMTEKILCKTFNSVRLKTEAQGVNEPLKTFSLAKCQQGSGYFRIDVLQLATKTKFP